MVASIPFRTRVVSGLFSLVALALLAEMLFATSASAGSVPRQLLVEASGSHLIPAQSLPLRLEGKGDSMSLQGQSVGGRLVRVGRKGSSPSHSKYDLLAEPTGLIFNAVEGQTDPTDQTISVARQHGGKHTTSWSVTWTASWLTVSPPTGSTTRETDVLVVSADTLNLPAGMYDGTITITPTNATGSSAQVVVILTVSPPQGTEPLISQNPAALAFSAEEGEAVPQTQPLGVSNVGGGSLSWVALEDASWLSLSHTAGTIETQTDTIGVTVDTQGLAAGTYSAPVILHSDDATNSPQTVPVTLTMNPPATSSALLTWDANTESDLAGYRAYVGTSSGVYGTPINVGFATNTEVSDLALGETYFFAVTAYDTAGNESGFSNEVSKFLN